MIINTDINFNLVNDPIRTEELIFEQLKNHKLNIPYVAMPIAFTINKFGINYVQKIIDKVENQFPVKKFFVCQHILVNKLNFYDNIVFTPHTENSDKFNFIPHYNPIFNEKPQLKKISERNLKMSFIGDFNTHVSRNLLMSLKKDDIFIEKTNKWFFEKTKEEQLYFKKIYTEKLLDSKMSLCPRGTGPSTLRFFESLSVGSIPIIFNNLKLPKEIQDLVYYIDMNDLESKINYLLHESDFVLQEKSNEITNIYWEKFSNNNLYKSILNKINEL